MVNRYVERVASESGSGLRQLYIPCFEDGCFTVEESGVFEIILVLLVKNKKFLNPFL